MSERIEINPLKDICTICNGPFKHKRVITQLYGDPLPIVKFITCHAKCERYKRYDETKILMKQFFLDKGVNIIDLN